jgi:hypothetical protein
MLVCGEVSKTPNESLLEKEIGRLNDDIHIRRIKDSMVLA